MLTFLRRFALPLGLAFAFAVSFLFVETSETFHECVEHAQYKAAQTPPHQKPADITVSFSMHQHCWGNFVEKNADGIVALFTIILAGSTIGLWISTNKLWKAGENQIALIK